MEACIEKREKNFHGREVHSRITMTYDTRKDSNQGGKKSAV